MSLSGPTGMRFAISATARWAGVVTASPASRGALAERGRELLDVAQGESELTIGEDARSSSQASVCELAVETLASTRERPGAYGGLCSAAPPGHSGGVPAGSAPPLVPRARSNADALSGPPGRRCVNCSISDPADRGTWTHGGDAEMVTARATASRA